MAGRARHNDFMKTYRLYNTSGDRKLVEEEGEAEYAKLKADPAAVERRVDQLKRKIKGREGTLTKFVKPLKPQSTEKEAEVQIVDAVDNTSVADVINVIHSTSATTGCSFEANCRLSIGI